MCRDTCRHIYIYFNFKFVRSQPTILSFSNLANVQPKHNQPPKKEKKETKLIPHLTSPSKLNSCKFLNLFGFSNLLPRCVGLVGQPKQDIGHPDSTLQPMACSSSMDMAPGWKNTGCTDSVMVERWDLVAFGSTGWFFCWFSFSSRQKIGFYCCCWSVCWCFSEMTDKWRWDVFLKTLKLCCMGFSIGGPCWISRRVVLKNRNALLGEGFQLKINQKKTSCKMRPSNVAATFLDPNWIPPNHAKGHAKNIHLEQRSKAIGDT